MKTTGYLLLGMMLGATIANAQDALAPAAAPKLAGLLLVLDKPYVAVRDYNRDQKQPNGKTLTRHDVTKYWRDSAGRTRSEVTREGDHTVWTYLLDPTAMVEYSWNNEKKVAFVTKMGDPIPAREATRPLQPGETRNVTTTVSGKRMKAQASLLPPKTIDGYETTGTHLLTYSDPEQKNLLMTIDRWYQPAFHVTLEEVIVDEQYGHRVWHFRSFKPEEAKAEMFQVPKGYTIKAQETPDTEQFE